MTTNYADFGISWESTTVARQAGEHRTDRVALKGTAEIPVPTDLGKLRAAIGDDRVNGFLNGSSIRVVAQDVNRRYLEACARGERKYNQDDLRALVWARISGKTVRLASGRTVTVTVNRRQLPDGTWYEGTELVEYQAAYAAALVDKGVPADVARDIALALTW